MTRLHLAAHQLCLAPIMTASVEQNGGENYHMQVFRSPASCTLPRSQKLIIDGVDQCMLQVGENGMSEAASQSTQQTDGGLLTSQGSVSKLIAAYSQPPAPSPAPSVSTEIRRTSSRAQQAILSASSPPLSQESSLASDLPSMAASPYLSPRETPTRLQSETPLSLPASYGKSHPTTAPQADHSMLPLPPLRMTSHSNNSNPAGVAASRSLPGYEDEHWNGDVDSQRPTTPRPEDIMDSFAALAPEPDPQSTQPLSLPESNLNTCSHQADATTGPGNTLHQNGRDWVGSYSATGPHPGMLQTWTGALPSTPSAGDQGRDHDNPEALQHGLAQNGSEAAAAPSLISTWPCSSADAAAAAVMQAGAGKVQKPPLPSGASASAAAAASRNPSSRSRASMQERSAASQIAAVQPVGRSTATSTSQAAVARAILPSSGTSQGGNGSAPPGFPAGSPPDRLRGQQLHLKGPGSGQHGNGQWSYDWRAGSVDGREDEDDWAAAVDEANAIRGDDAPSY